MTTKDSYLEAIKMYKDLIAQQEDLIAIFPVNTFHMKEILKDLEVLEILRKQSKFEFNQLSVEAYAKLKQWLEENENDNHNGTNI